MAAGSAAAPLGDEKPADVDSSAPCGQRTAGLELRYGRPGAGTRLTLTHGSTAIGRCYVWHAVLAQGHVLEVRSRRDRRGRPAYLGRLTGRGQRR